MSITITDDLFALKSFLLDSYDIFEVFAAVDIRAVFARLQWCEKADHCVKSFTGLLFGLRNKART